MWYDIHIPQKKETRIVKHMKNRILLTAILAVMILSLAIFASACTGTEDPAETDPAATDAVTTAEPPQNTEQETEPMTNPVTEAPTEAVTEPLEDPALNVFPEDGENIGIGIFWEPPYQYTTPEQYDWIRDANITFIEITNREGAIHKEANDLQLKLAAERGINVAYSVGVDGKDLLRMS